MKSLELAQPQLTRELVRLELALEALANAQIERSRAKEVLEVASATTLPSGQIVGKAEERAAQLRTMLGEEYRQLAQAEEALIWARTRLECARVWFEYAGGHLEADSG